MITTKQRLLCLAVFAAMTTACSSGGSSLNTGGGNATNIPGATGPEFIKEKNVENSEVYKLNQADNSEPVEYGYSIPSSIQGTAYVDKLATTTHDNKEDQDKLKDELRSLRTKEAISESNADNFDTLTYINSPHAADTDFGTGEKTRTITITKDGFVKGASNVYSAPDYTVTGKNIDDSIKGNLTVILAEKGNAYPDYDGLKMVEFENTKAGSVFDYGGSNYYANIFYRAKNPSVLLPTSGTAKYNGIWTVSRKLKLEEDDYKEAGHGTEEFNELSGAEFTVRFADNEIDGKFHKQLASGRGFGYSFEKAKIDGNTFTATNAKSIDDTVEDEATVTGGFFGKQGAELAGKLIGEKAVGVFAAKQHEDEGEELVEGKPTTYNSSGVINANLDAKAEKAFNEDGFVQALEKTSKLPNINMIEINGTTIDLSEAIKAQDKNNTIFLNTDKLPLQFTRFGSIQGETATDLSYFYQGQLTQDMPNDKANYEGSWIAHGLSKNGTPYTVGKDNLGKVKFDVDFGNKLLSGEFLSNSGAKAMTLGKTEFDGNSFSGVASIENTGLSTNRTPGKDGAIKGNVNISGNFFGDNANEIGGKFNKDDLSFAGVFAGKKTK